MSGKYRSWRPTPSLAQQVRPTLTQQESIRTLAKRLDYEVQMPATEAEARFLIDGLRNLERTRKRAAR